MYTCVPIYMYECIYLFNEKSLKYFLFLSTVLECFWTVMIFTLKYRMFLLTSFYLLLCKNYCTVIILSSLIAPTLILGAKNLVTALRFQFTLTNYNFIGVKAIGYEKSFSSYQMLSHQEKMIERTVVPILFSRCNACLAQFYM